MFKTFLEWNVYFLNGLEEFYEVVVMENVDLDSSRLSSTVRLKIVCETSIFIHLSKQIIKDVVEREIP